MIVEIIAIEGCIHMLLCDCNAVHNEAKNILKEMEQ